MKQAIDASKVMIEVALERLIERGEVVCTNQLIPLQ